MVQHNYSNFFDVHILVYNSEILEPGHQHLNDRAWPPALFCAYTRNAAPIPGTWETTRQFHLLGTCRSVFHAHACEDRPAPAPLPAIVLKILLLDISVKTE